MSANDLHVEAGGRRIPLAVRINPRARSIGIRIPSDGSAPRLTLPRPAMLLQGLAFAQSRAEWILARMSSRAAGVQPFRPGLVIPWGGARLLLEQGPTRVAHQAENRLAVAGDGPLFAGRVRRWLIADAKVRLSIETQAMASAFGLVVTGVAVGDARSRWGSCCSSGTIRYSWRLLLAPDFVRKSVVAHEVAHLAEANHGPRFWALATEILGQSHAPARSWLRHHGASLHGWGREAPAPHVTFT